MEEDMEDNLSLKQKKRKSCCKKW